MKIEQETKPETCKVPSEGSGGTVDLRAKLLARRKAQGAQINESGHKAGSASNEDQCVSKVLASGLNIGTDDDDDEEDDDEYEDIEDEDDDEYMDIEDEDDDGIEVKTQVGHGTTDEDWIIIESISRKPKILI